MGHVEVGYVIIQVICVIIIGMLYRKIKDLPDGGDKINIPEVVQLGQVVKPATKLTVKEHDIDKWTDQIKQIVMGALVLGGVYWKWGYLFPLVMQLLMTPLQLWDSPLVQIHFFGKHIKRPFPVPNPFSMPGMLQAEAPAEEKKKEKKEKSKNGDKKSS